MHSTNIMESQMRICETEKQAIALLDESIFILLTSNRSEAIMQECRN